MAYFKAGAVAAKHFLSYICPFLSITTNMASLHVHVAQCSSFRFAFAGFDFGFSIYSGRLQAVACRQDSPTISVPACITHIFTMLHAAPNSCVHYLHTRVVSPHHY